MAGFKYEEGGLAAQTLEAYHHYNDQLQIPFRHILDILPSLPGDDTFTAPKTIIKVNSPYPVFDPTNDAMIMNGLVLLNYAVRKLAESDSPLLAAERKEFLETINTARQMMHITVDQGDRTRELLLSDPTSEELRDGLRAIFPDVFVNANDRLREQAAKHLIPGVPQDEAPHRDTIAIIPGSSDYVIESVIKTHAEPGQKYILPVPFYFNYPLIIEGVQGQAVTVDTQQTNLRLTPEALETAIRVNDIKPGEGWLILANPEHITVSSYSKDELQAFGRIAAKYQLNVLVDEIYARTGNAEHYSLATLDIKGADGWKLKDHVFTTTGNSKQMPFRHKYGVACGPQGRMADIIANTHSIPSDDMADFLTEVHAETLARTFEPRAAENRQKVVACYHDVAESSSLLS